MEASLPLATAIWGFSSAIAVAAIGVLTLRGASARPRGALPFGLFCVLWGLQIVAGNAANIARDAAVAEILYLSFLALLITLPYLLVEFALSQLNVPRRSIGPRLLRAAVIASSGIAAMLLVVAPQTLYEGLVELPAHHAPQWGALFVPVVQFPLVAALALATLALFAAFRRAPTPRIAQRSATLLAGLGIYVSFVAANNFTFFAVATFVFNPSVNNILFTFLYIFLLGVVLSVAVSAVAAAAASRDPEERSRHRFLAAAFLVPLPLGMGEAMLATGPLPFLETVGLWRLAGVAVIAYGIARWRIYDLPQRASKAAATATGTAASAATGAAAYGAGALLTTTAVIPVVLGILVVGATLIPSVRFARRLFASKQDDFATPEDPAYGQRIDAYRAALEASFARGTLDEDEEFLAALRERFGISEGEDRVLRYYAKSSVIVSRKDEAWEAFERLRLLGEGGAGRTWLARDRARDRLVVLKEPLEHWQRDPQSREMVLREARLAARVRHPNVVAIEEVVEGKGSPVIVMEYLEGGTLSDLLRRQGALPWREAVPLVVDVLRGVEAIHHAGIVHRDIKPSNVLLTREGLPKVADFGIALPHGGAAGGKTLVDIGSTARAGTLSYMPPEVRTGISLGDRSSDLYACGALLHECLYGAPPGAHGPVVVRRDVPPPLTALLARSLSERPQDRPASARAFADDLARLLKP